MAPTCTFTFLPRLWGLQHFVPCIPPLSLLHISILMLRHLYYQSNCCYLLHADTTYCLIPQYFAGTLFTPSTTCMAPAAVFHHRLTPSLLASFCCKKKNSNPLFYSQNIHTMTPPANCRSTFSPGTPTVSCQLQSQPTTSRTTVLCQQQQQ